MASITALWIALDKILRQLRLYGFFILNWWTDKSPRGKEKWDWPDTRMSSHFRGEIRHRQLDSMMKLDVHNKKIMY